jgi:carbamoyltransferase
VGESDRARLGVRSLINDANPRYHALLSTFKRRTDCAVLVNTSFNVRGEPIVCTPEDAFRCFMGTEMDTLVIGNAVEQPQHLAKDYKNKFEGD